MNNVNTTIDAAIQTTDNVTIVCENTSDAFLLSSFPKSLPEITDPPTPTHKPIFLILLNSCCLYAGMKNDGMKNLRI